MENAVAAASEAPAIRISGCKGNILEAGISVPKEKLVNSQN